MYNSLYEYKCTDRFVPWAPRSTSGIHICTYFQPWYRGLKGTSLNTNRMRRSWAESPLGEWVAEGGYNSAGGSLTPIMPPSFLSSLCILHALPEEAFQSTNEPIIKRRKNLNWNHITVMLGLSLFYILAISKAFEGWVPTCDSVHSWRPYSTAPLGYQVACTVTYYPTQPHYPHYHDTVQTNPCPILLMLSDRLGSNTGQLPYIILKTQFYSCRVMYLNKYI